MSGSVTNLLRFPFSGLQTYGCMVNAMSNGGDLIVLNHSDLKTWSCSSNEVTSKLLPAEPLDKL